VFKGGRLILGLAPLRPVLGRYRHRPPRLLERFRPNQLQQPRRGPVHQRTPVGMIVPVGTEQASREQQRQRLGAIPGQRDRAIGTNRKLGPAPDLLDSPPGGHAVCDHDGQDLGLLLGQPGQLASR
jgi:hypothetical protein